MANENAAVPVEKAAGVSVTVAPAFVITAVVVASSDNTELVTVTVTLDDAARPPAASGVTNVAKSVPSAPDAVMFTVASVIEREPAKGVLSDLNAAGVVAGFVTAAAAVGVTVVTIGAAEVTRAPEVMFSIRTVGEALSLIVPLKLTEPPAVAKPEALLSTIPLNLRPPMKAWVVKVAPNAAVRVPLPLTVQPLIRILSVSGVKALHAPETVPTKDDVLLIRANTETCRAGLFISAPAILIVAWNEEPAGSELVKDMAGDVPAFDAWKLTALAVAAVAEKCVLEMLSAVPVATT